LEIVCESQKIVSAFLEFLRTVQKIVFTLLKFVWAF
jgi:hypothetical protein